MHIPPAGAIVTIGKSNAGATTSTEVFQKLLDGKYITDPSVFFIIGMPGKVKAAPGARLTAENVCFDVTSGATNDSSGKLPLVFTTGYEVDYTNGGTIMPRLSGPASPFPGIAVGYRDGSARFLPFTLATTTTQIIPQGTELGGDTYWQLKP